MENILDHSPSKKPPKNGKPLRIFHLLEIFLVVIILWGWIEKTEHTQFISGISLTFWGLVSLALLNLSIPILYEKVYQSKPINFLFAGIFGILLAANLLGRLEKIEHTQFIPEISINYWALMGLTFFSLFAPIIHEIRRKASLVNIILVIILGISISILFLFKIEITEQIQFSEGIRFKKHVDIPALIILTSIPLLIYRYSFHKEYRYHYIRFFLLVLFSF